MTDSAQIIRILSYHGFTAHSSLRGLVIRPQPPMDSPIVPVVKRYRDDILAYVTDCESRDANPEKEAFDSRRKWMHGDV